MNKQQVIDQLDHIHYLLISAVSVIQNTADAVKQDRPWRTDDLADVQEDVAKANKLLIELL